MAGIGIFGGSFDPVHLGHVSLALQAKEEAGLDKVIFVPAKISPFKLDRKPADDRMREEMIRLSIKGYEGMEISSYETDHEEVSYTVNTLRYFTERCGDNSDIYFITGTDSFLTIEKWYMADEILSSYRFIVGARPGYREDELDQVIDRISSRYGCEIIRLHNRMLDISSSEIRSRASKGLSLEGLVNAESERYIKEHELYR